MSDRPEGPRPTLLHDLHPSSTASALSDSSWQKRIVASATTLQKTQAFDVYGGPAASLTRYDSRAALMAPSRALFVLLDVLYTWARCTPTNGRGPLICRIWT